MLVFENNNAVMMYAMVRMLGLSLPDDFSGDYISEDVMRKVLTDVASLEDIKRMNLVLWKQHNP